VNVFNGFPTGPQTPVGVSQVFAGSYKDSLKVNDTTTASCRAIPTAESASFVRKVFWRSADSTIVSVLQTSDTTVRVTGRKAGSSQVRCYAVADSTKFATLAFFVSVAGTVVQTPPTVSPVLLIAFSGDSVISVNVGKTKQMPLPRCSMVDPTKSCTLLWESENAAFVNVNQLSGLITGVAPGQALICVKVKEDTHFEACYPHPVSVVP
jgi:uncharacterized protein YjdB